jgi:hypothetical protein
MIICKNCKHEEPHGALFCSECGAKLPLEPLEKDVTKVVKVKPTPPAEPRELPGKPTSAPEPQEVPGKQTSAPEPQEVPGKPTSPPELQEVPGGKPFTPAESQEWHGKTTVPLHTQTSGEKLAVTLHIVEVKVDLPLVERDEFTLGRVSEGQPLIPEIDLSVFKAYEQGVSRLHAVIGIKADRVTITDLGSANGTWVNGERILPHSEHELKDGDVISLGTLKIETQIG